MRATSETGEVSGGNGETGENASVGRYEGIEEAHKEDGYMISLVVCSLTPIFLAASPTLDP